MVLKVAVQQAPGTLSILTQIHDTAAILCKNYLIAIASRNFLKLDKESKCVEDSTSPDVIISKLGSNHMIHVQSTSTSLLFFSIA